MDNYKTPKFGDGNMRLNHAIDLLESGMSIAEVSEITGYSRSSLYVHRSNILGTPKENKCPTVTDAQFHKEWTETVNKFRKAAGLPLFKVGCINT